MNNPGINDFNLKKPVNTGFFLFKCAASKLLIIMFVYN